MMLEKKNMEIIDDNSLQCPFCKCQFASKYDLASHLKAYGTDKVEHVRELNKVHRRIDPSFRGTVAKDIEKKALDSLKSRTRFSTN